MQCGKQLSDQGDIQGRRGREEDELALGVVIAVLGRHREGRHQPVVLGVLDQEFQEELRRALHDRVVVLEELPIAGEEVVLPEVLAEPGAADGPHAVPGRVDRGGPAPEIDVVVGHPAAAAVVDVGGLRAGDRDVLEHVEEGLVALGEVAVTSAGQ